MTGPLEVRWRRPGLTRSIIGVVILGALLSLVTAYRLGQQGVLDCGPLLTPSVGGSSNQGVPAARLSGPPGTLAQSLRTERQANRELQRELAELRTETEAMQQELALYRKVINPEYGEQGLSLRSLELLPALEPGVVRYVLLLTRSSPNRDPIHGTVELFTVTDDAVEPSPPQVSIPFKLKYFQKITGHLQAPTGTVPTAVLVRVNPESAGLPVIEQRHAWPR